MQISFIWLFSFMKIFHANLFMLIGKPKIDCPKFASRNIAVSMWFRLDANRPCSANVWWWISRIVPIWHDQPTSHASHNFRVVRPRAWAILSEIHRYCRCPDFWMVENWMCRKCIHISMENRSTSICCVFWWDSMKPMDAWKYEKWKKIK